MSDVTLWVTVPESSGIVITVPDPGECMGEAPALQPCVDIGAVVGPPGATGPAGPPGLTVATFSDPAGSTAVGTYPWTAPDALIITEIIFGLGVAGDVTIDVLVDGVSVFTVTPLPSIVGGLGPVTVVPDLANLPAGSRLTVDIVSVDGVADRFATVQVILVPAP